jgi:phosphatidate cytidylyltransferase
MLGTRVLSGVVLVAALVLLLYADQWLAPWHPLWFALSALAMATAALEFSDLLRETPSRPSTCAVLGGVAAVLVANWIPHVWGVVGDSHRLSGLIHEPNAAVGVLAWPLLSFVGVLMVTFVAQSVKFETPGGAVAMIAGTLLVVAYVGLLGSFIVQLRWFDGCKHGLVPLAFLIVTAKGADVGAYTVGRIAGRHKLWPAVSPNKTVEGAVGGLGFACLAALIVEAVTRNSNSLTGVGWAGAVVFGVVVGVVAQLGDLMESMVKRDCLRKDASASVPGFGGVLDVLDSLLFAAPVAYGLWLLLGP